MGESPQPPGLDIASLRRQAEAEGLDPDQFLPPEPSGEKKPYRPPGPSEHDISALEGRIEAAQREIESAAQRGQDSIPEDEFPTPPPASFNQDDISAYFAKRGVDYETGEQMQPPTGSAKKSKGDGFLGWRRWSRKRDT